MLENQKRSQCRGTATQIKVLTHDQLIALLVDTEYWISRQIYNRPAANEQYIKAHKLQGVSVKANIRLFNTLSHDYTRLAGPGRVLAQQIMNIAYAPPRI